MALTRVSKYREYSSSDIAGPRSSPTGSSVQPSPYGLHEIAAYQQKNVNKHPFVNLNAVMELSFPLWLQIYHQKAVCVYTAGRLINSASNLSKDLSIAFTAQ